MTCTRIWARETNTYWSYEIVSEIFWVDRSISFSANIMSLELHITGKVYHVSMSCKITIKQCIFLSIGPIIYFYIGYFFHNIHVHNTLFDIIINQITIHNTNAQITYFFLNIVMIILPWTIKKLSWHFTVHLFYREYPDNITCIVSNHHKWSRRSTFSWVDVRQVMKNFKPMLAQ